MTANSPLHSAILNSLQRMSEKATKGMMSILKNGLFPPADPNGLMSETDIDINDHGDIIELATHLPVYAYWAKWGRGTGKMPPDEPIREWVKKHNISEEAVFPIRKKMSLEGSKRFRDKNPLNFDLPLVRMVEMIEKTLSVVCVETVEKEIYPWAKTLDNEQLEIKL